MAEPARYVLGELLGEGGFALVYRAWDAVLRREVALKQLRPELCRDDRTRRRFRREAQRLARLDHPSLVPVHDVGELNGQPFFTMRLINGVRLTDIELAESPLPVARAVLLLGEVAAVVQYLHDQGVLHLDVKSANVMVASGDRVTVMDLGISRAYDHTPLTLTGPLTGSPHMMSPEQLSGSRVGPPADIYALGVLAFELLCGRPPFTGPLPRLVYAHMHEPPPPPSSLRRELPAELDAAILAALAKDPPARPASAAAFATAVLRAAAVTEPAGRRARKTLPDTADAPPPSWNERASAAAGADRDRDTEPALHPRPMRAPVRRRLLVSTAAGIGLALLAGAAVVLMPEFGTLQRPEPEAVLAGAPTAAPEATEAGEAIVSDLAVWDQVLAPGGRRAPFSTRDSAVGCFTLRGGSVRLTAFVTSDHFRPPDVIGSAGAAGTVARSEPAEVAAGERCLAVAGTQGPIPPGDWMLWLMAGSEVAARQPFTVLAADATPPPPSPTTTASATATPTRTPVAAAPTLPFPVAQPFQTPATAATTPIPAVTPPSSTPVVPSATPAPATPTPTPAQETPTPQTATPTPSRTPGPVRTLEPR